MPKPPIRGYRLLPLCYGIQALEDKRIKLARPMEVNDPFEIAGIGWRTRDEQKRLERFKQEVNDRFAMLCLLKGWNDPVPWSHYGEMHKGVCLGFDVDPDLGNYGLQPVDYAKLKLGRPNASAAGWSAKTERDLLYTKFASWSYEGELRAFVPLSQLVPGRGKDGRTLYFMNFGDALRLREVFLGHLSDRKSLLDKFRSLADRIDTSIDVHGARLGYGEFEIRPDGRYRRPGIHSSIGL